MNESAEAVERQWREIEQLREHVAGCHCSRCCFNLEAITTAAYEKGRVEALKQATEQDCHLYLCGAAAILAESQQPREGEL